MEVNHCQHGVQLVTHPLNDWLLPNVWSIRIIRPSFDVCDMRFTNWGRQYLREEICDVLFASYMEHSHIPRLNVLTQEMVPYIHMPHSTGMNWVLSELNTCVVILKYGCGTLPVKFQFTQESSCSQQLLSQSTRGVPLCFSN